jgi:hypothetical protein
MTLEEPAMAKRQHISDDDLDPFEPYTTLGDEQADEPGFERIRRSTDKQTSPKADRRQRDKEWGKMHNKFHKQRTKLDGNKKP